MGEGAASGAFESKAEEGVGWGLPCSNAAESSGKERRRLTTTPEAEVPDLTLHGLLPLSETAELVATELVGNAVRRTKGPAALRLRWAGRVLRIGVWDADPTPPAPPLHSSAEAENGRGLDLVRNSTDGWGWYPLDAAGDLGKFVGCELLAA